MQEPPGQRHVLADFAADIVPLDEDERKFVQYQINNQQDRLLDGRAWNDAQQPQHHTIAPPQINAGQPTPAPPVAGAAVPMQLPAIAGEAVLTATAMETAQRVIPHGKPIRLIMDVSHDQMMAMMRESKERIESAAAVSWLIPWVSRLFCVCALVMLFLLVVAVVRHRMKSSKK